MSIEATGIIVHDHNGTGSTGAHPRSNQAGAARVYAAFAGLILSAFFGLTVAIKFHAPEFLTNHAALTWGRLRTAGIATIMSRVALP